MIRFAIPEAISFDAIVKDGKLVASERLEALEGFTVRVDVVPVSLPVAGVRKLVEGVEETLDSVRDSPIDPGHLSAPTVGLLKGPSVARSHPGCASTGCYCTSRCMAPVVMGRQTPCLDPEKAEGFASTSRERAEVLAKLLKKE